ncbi:MAG: NGG1p interacting factor NIF3 [Syntrophomonadaceae bacterium]|jgi:putative NIF3 family GTP cyclohydrolase 1 type 2
MKLKDIYELAISLGKRHDPRGDEIGAVLKREQEAYEGLKDSDKEPYDVAALTNPYSDTRILQGSGDETVKVVMTGIDIETPEILLADRLKSKGQPIDALIAHHPEGIAQAALHQVMAVQADMLAQAGVPISIAEGIMETRIAEVHRTLMPVNHQRAVDAARLLGLPFMCVHSPADNLANHYLNNLLAGNACRTVQDVLESLLSIPEYHLARQLKAGPQLIVGDKKRRAGQIFVKMTGGTGGSEKSYEQLAAAGVGTVIAMHMTDKHRRAAKDNHINVIIAGHMASDSLGMNLFLDELEKEGIAILPCAGLLRVKRQ